MWFELEETLKVAESTVSSSSSSASNSTSAAVDDAHLCCCIGTKTLSPVSWRSVEPMGGSCSRQPGRRDVSAIRSTRVVGSATSTNPGGNWWRSRAERCWSWRCEGVSLSSNGRWSAGVGLQSEVPTSLCFDITGIGLIRTPVLIIALVCQATSVSSLQYDRLVVYRNNNDLMGGDRVPKCNSLIKRD